MCYVWVGVCVMVCGSWCISCHVPGMDRLYGFAIESNNNLWRHSQGGHVDVPCALAATNYCTWSDLRRLTSSDIPITHEQDISHNDFSHIFFFDDGALRKEVQYFFNRLTYIVSEHTSVLNQKFSSLSF